MFVSLQALIIISIIINTKGFLFQENYILVNSLLPCIFCFKKCNKFTVFI